MKLSWLLAASGIVSACLAQSSAAASHWVATWGTAQQQMARGGGVRGGPAQPAGAAQPAGRGPGAPQPVGPGRGTGPQRRFGIPPGLMTVNNQTVRMIVRTSIGGQQVRVRLSNALGGSIVRVGAAHIALRDKDSAIVPSSDHALTFSGNKTALMYPGQVLLSDPVALKVPALGDVAVSLYFPGDTGAPTAHAFGLHTTYLSKEGDVTGAATIADATMMQSYYWLAGLDVMASAGAGTLVTLGDSITDGDQSTPDANGMWPAVLAARLQANKATSDIGVVNAGIAGNRVLGEGGALSRLYHDVLTQPGLKWITLLEGINDITGGTRANSSSMLTSGDLIAAYRQIIETAHLHGVKVIGCTITPYGGSSVYSDAGEAVREAVNNWIRQPGNFDAVVDFDAVTRDPMDPKRFRPEVDSPDLLHPGDSGYKLMGQAVDLAIFGSGTAKRK